MNPSADPGKETIGPYRLLRLIGRGSAGSVFEAEQPGVGGRHVALKVLSPWFFTEREMVTRFRREAEIAGALYHPNIVRIYDLDVDGETHYFAMQLLEGRRLSDMLREGGALDFADALAIVRPVAAALEHAHRQGVIHRNVAPGNFMVGPDGHVTLLGFFPELPAGQFGGVPGCLAPEQIDGTPADPRWDVYSLGAVVFEMLAGNNPFRAQDDTSAEVLQKQIAGTPWGLRALRPGIPARLEEIVHRAIARDPAQRFDGIAGFLAALEEALKSPDTKVVQPKTERWEKDAASAPPLAISHRLGVPALLADPAAHRVTLSWRGLTLATPVRLDEIESGARVAIVSRRSENGEPILQIAHPRLGTHGEYAVRWVCRGDDGDLAVLQLPASWPGEDPARLTVVRVLDRDTLGTFTPEDALATHGRLFPRGEVWAKFELAEAEKVFGPLPDHLSPAFRGRNRPKPGAGPVLCFGCRKPIDPAADACPSCRRRAAPRCPKCGERLTVAQGKWLEETGSLDHYAWNSDWDFRCCACGHECEGRLEIPGAHPHFEFMGPSTIEIAGGESVHMYCDDWDHVPTLAIRVTRPIHSKVKPPVGKLVGEEKIVLTVEEWRAIFDQLQGPLRALMERERWSRDTT